MDTEDSDNLIINNLTLQDFSTWLETHTYQDVLTFLGININHPLNKVQGFTEDTLPVCWVINTFIKDMLVTKSKNPRIVEDVFTFPNKGVNIVYLDNSIIPFTLPTCFNFVMKLTASFYRKDLFRLVQALLND